MIISEKNHVFGDKNAFLLMTVISALSSGENKEFENSLKLKDLK